jgi:ABC-2 type transport system ATP-binding protein
MIEVSALTKHYRDLVAVENVSFYVKPGDIVGFLGPNAAGKSTTMKMITGFMPATSGEIKVAGFNVFEKPMEVRRRIGYLPEIPPVYPDLTVVEYLKFVGKLKGLRGNALKSDVERVVNRVNLLPVIDRLIRNLSKGFQQRTGLAQALLGNPDVLILDEPTVGLDPRQIGDFRSLIRELAGDHTVILSTHILQEVTATCERVIIINRGRIVADDVLKDLVTKHRKPSGEQASLEEIFLSLTEI